MGKYIIYEAANFSDVHVEQKNPDSIRFICTLQSAGVPNRNGRIYPKSVLEKALSMPNIQERLRTKTWFGEAGHPLDSSVQRQMTVDLRNVAFIIEEIWWEGNLLKGKCETANTACGHDMKGLIEQGCKVAFSLRAQGNVHTNPTNGLIEVEDGLQILCFDWVGVPSHAEAYMDNICEATAVAMYKMGKNKLTQEVLCEAENLFMNGDMYDPEEEVQMETVDYTKKYNPQFKYINEMYIPEKNDEVLSITENEVLIKNDEKKIQKKVLTEDYLVKDIRNRISELMGGSNV